MSGERARWLHVSEVELLRMWGREVRRAFRGAMPYLVGSVLERRDWRDVDVRVMLPAEDHDALTALVSVRELNLAYSLWGRQVTGLPIDFQIQQMESANEDYGGRPRDPLGITAERLEPQPSPPEAPLMQVDPAQPVPSSTDSGESRSSAAGPESESADLRRAGAPPPEASSYAGERVPRATNKATGGEVQVTITAHIISDPGCFDRWCVSVNDPSVPTEPIDRTFSTPGLAVDAIVGWAAQRGITFLYDFSLSIATPPSTGAESRDDR